MISIHPSLAGRDDVKPWVIDADQIFQSTRPSRDGTRGTPRYQACKGFQSTRPSRDGTVTSSEDATTSAISIPPSLAGRDVEEWAISEVEKNFNPPVPRGTGPSLGRTTLEARQFQSTRPSRDGTQPVQRGNEGLHISIHPSLAGRDGMKCKQGKVVYVFQSTRPSRDGTAKSASFHFTFCINATVMLLK